MKPDTIGAALQEREQTGRVFIADGIEEAEECCAQAMRHPRFAQLTVTSDGPRFRIVVTLWK